MMILTGSINFASSVAQKNKKVKGHIYKPSSCQDTRHNSSGSDHES
jgi:hypothetical protein